MKTNEEMTAAVLERVHREQAEARRKKQQRTHTLTAAACCCAVLVLAGGAVYAARTGRLRLSQPKSAARAEDAQAEEMLPTEDAPVRGGAANGTAQPGGQAAGEAAAQTESTQPAQTEGDDPIAAPQMLGKPSASEQDGSVSPTDRAEEAGDICIKEGDTGPYSYTPKIPMISGYDGPPLTVVPCVEPYDGSVMLSAMLQDALVVHEGELVLYRVRLRVYQNSVVLPDDGAAAQAEVQRLADAGYTVAQETFWDGQEHHTALTLHATEKQLREFPGTASYGYRLSLYDEAPCA